MTEQQREITPALRFNVLTPLYDVIVRYTTRENTFKSMLLDRASINNGDAVLDVGCGTGTLLQAIATQTPGAHLTGLDADPAVLGIARRKLAASASASDAQCELIKARSTRINLADASFDHVVSTLFFHHLAPADKQTTVAEIHRVLRPGGSVHIADWGQPTGTLQRLAYYQIQLLDGFATTTEHVSSQLTERFRNGGFESVEETGYLRTMFGTLRFIRAAKPS